MDKICYKVAMYHDVVRLENSKVYFSYKSTGASCGNVDFLTYRIGEETFPKVGKIFVFDTTENAYNFFHYCGGHAIFIGMAKNVSYPAFCSNRMLDIDKFWELKKQKKSVRDISQPVFKGTVWCDSFIPEEIIYAINCFSYC